MQGIGGDRAKLAGPSGLSALKPMPTPRMGSMDAIEKDAVSAIRFVGVANTVGASTPLTWPVGTTPGDLAIIVANANSSPLPPSNSASWNHLGYGPETGGYIAWKILNGADFAITTGSYSAFQTTTVWVFRYAKRAVLRVSSGDGTGSASAGATITSAGFAKSTSSTLGGIFIATQADMSSARQIIAPPLLISAGSRLTYAPANQVAIGQQYLALGAYTFRVADYPDNAGVSVTFGTWSQASISIFELFM